MWGPTCSRRLTPSTRSWRWPRWLDHDLAGRLLGGGDAGGRDVLDAPVGLACEVAGVGVTPVAVGVGQDVGPHGHRLGLELLEPPVPALGPGPPSVAHDDGDLAGDRVGHVLLERQGVHRAGGVGRVVQGGRGVPSTGGVAPGDAAAAGAAPATTGLATGSFTPVSTWCHVGPGAACARVDQPGPGGRCLLYEQYGRAVGDAGGRDAPARVVDDDVVRVVLGHGDLHVDGVGRSWPPAAGADSTAAGGVPASAPGAHRTGHRRRATSAGRS